MLQLTGQLVEIEHVPPFERGDFKRDAFPRLHILSGRTVYPVDIDPRTFADSLPAVHTFVQADITPRAFAAKGGANIAYNLLAVRQAQDPAHANRKAA
jgi:hypothetical protein